MCDKVQQTNRLYKISYLGVSQGSVLGPIYLISRKFVFINQVILLSSTDDNIMSSKNTRAALATLFDHVINAALTFLELNRMFAEQEQFRTFIVTTKKRESIKRKLSSS